MRFLLPFALLASFAGPAFAEKTDPLAKIEEAQNQPDKTFDGKKDRRDGAVVVVDEKPYTTEYDWRQNTCNTYNDHRHPEMNTGQMLVCLDLPPQRVKEWGVRQKVRIADRPAFERAGAKDGAIKGALIGGGLGAVAGILLATSGFGLLGLLVGLGALALGAGIGALIGYGIAHSKPDEFDRNVPFGDAPVAPAH